MRKEQELKRLAVDIYEGKIFGTWSIKNADLVPCVFMPIAMLSKKQLQKMEKDNVVHFFEYFNKAGPMGINGMPSFMSMQILTQKESDKLMPLIETLKSQKEKFMLKEKAK